MEDQVSGNELTSITFTIMGNKFTLRCAKKQENDLKKSIEQVRNISADILRKTPNLSITQAAILTAIESQNRLQSYLGASTPFQREAKSLIRIIKKNLNDSRD